MATKKVVNMTPEEHATLLEKRKKYDRKYDACRRKRLIREKREQGLCGKCREVVMYPHVLCEKHHKARQAIIRNGAKQRRETYIRDGRCPKCAAWLIGEEKKISKYCMNCRTGLYRPRAVATIGKRAESAKLEGY